MLRGRLIRLTNIKIRRLYLVWLALANEVLVSSPFCPATSPCYLQAPISCRTLRPGCSYGPIARYPGLPSSRAVEG